MSATDDREGLDGAGYPTTPYRIEFRIKREPHSREQLLRALDVMAECGVKAWWYAVADRGSYPMFRTKHLLYREDVATDLYPWLVGEAHKLGISLFNWEYLNTPPLDLTNRLCGTAVLRVLGMGVCESTITTMLLGVTSANRIAAVAIR